MKDLKPYHYTFCGLKNVYIEGLCMEDDHSEMTVRVPAIQELHKLIAHNLLSFERNLNADEICFLRSEAGLTLEDLSDAMHLSIDVVRKWEDGDGAISAEDDKHFRRLMINRLALPAQNLQKAQEFEKILIQAKCETDGKSFVRYEKAA